MSCGGRCAGTWCRCNAPVAAAPRRHIRWGHPFSTTSPSHPAATLTIITLYLHWHPTLQRGAADKVLTAFREHPEAWTRVDAILESASNAQAKFIALQVLETLIKFRWKTLPPEQREGIRTYLVQKIITVRMRGCGRRCGVRAGGMQ